MTLSEELQWRGFINQTTYKDITAIDKDPISFYFGVDPSAPSMQIGNLAAAMMVKHFIKHGHKAFLLVGGATGLIGDPDGKSEERTLKSLEEVSQNKQAIAAQYSQVLGGLEFTLVDNYDWFKDIDYLTFLRDIGKHVPMRQMLGRDFIQTRLGEEGDGISYAEFSYVLIQAYDFLELERTQGVSLQVCGSDQWGNSIAGVELIRRIDGKESHVWSIPLILNKSTGKKFGKTEDGAVWLDPIQTTPTQFYQFWINVDDEGVEDYMKIYTELDKAAIDAVMDEHAANRQQRIAQHRLAKEVTTIVHGAEATAFAETVTQYLTGEKPVGEANDAELDEIRRQVPSVKSSQNGSIIDSLSQTLAASKSDARRLLGDNAVSINGTKVARENFEAGDFQNGRLLLRKGKKYKDSALIELSDV